MEELVFTFKPAGNKFSGTGSLYVNLVAVYSKDQYVGLLANGLKGWVFYHVHGLYTETFKTREEAAAALYRESFVNGL